MTSPASRTALKIAQKRKRMIRLQDVFNYVEKWVEAPLTVGEIVDKGRDGYVEIKCTDHDRIIKVKTKKQLMKEDLILCKVCSKERYSASMMKKMNEYQTKMEEKYQIPRFAFKKAKGWKNTTITPEMIESGLEDYYKRGGTVTKIG